MTTRSIILAGALCVAPLTVLHAQQATDTTGAAATAPTAPAIAPTSGPRVSAPFGRVEPMLAAAHTAPPASYRRKAQHTIVVSTTVLILSVIILVLLIF